MKGKWDILIVMTYATFIMMIMMNIAYVIPINLSHVPFYYVFIVAKRN